MPKRDVADAARRRRGELADAVEGQLAELCRDLGVQVKRIRQLQEQADELRLAFRDWVSHTGPTSFGKPTRSSREGRR